MTIPQVLEADTRLAQSSAYRNLVVLEAAGVVTRSSPTTISPATNSPSISPITTIT